MFRLIRLNSPSISQLNRPVYASNDHEKRNNAESHEHQYHAPRRIGPASVFLLWFICDLASWTVVAKSNNELESKDGVQYDSDCIKERQIIGLYSYSIVNVSPNWTIIPTSMMLLPRLDPSGVSAVAAIAPPAAWMMRAVTSAAMNIFESEYCSRDQLPI